MGRARSPSEASLTPIEERILVALFRSKEHCLLSDEISRAAKISISTLAYEQKRLFALGLLQKRVRRFMVDDRISRRIIYELTLKGNLIAIHLDHVSDLLTDRKVICSEDPFVLQFEGNIN